ncbi:hypothetical protein [Aliikangiella maris]|uniref:Uncharacterized protein n=2 Tax=Aliikangiella maris TaxID=3162458 RepID=A0ABV3MJJ8_9GAMM
MKNFNKLLAKAITITSLSLASSVVFSANAPVNIVYPISGNSYNNYFTTSFGVTCAGGQHTAYWYLDGVQIGQANFYDQLSVQFSQKAPQGNHRFEVRTTCNSYDIVRFNVL